MSGGISRPLGSGEAQGLCKGLASLPDQPSEAPEGRHLSCVDSPLLPRPVLWHDAFYFQGYFKDTCSFSFGLAIQSGYFGRCGFLLKKLLETSLLLLFLLLLLSCISELLCCFPKKNRVPEQSQPLIKPMLLLYLSGCSQHRKFHFGGSLWTALWTFGVRECGGGGGGGGGAGRRRGCSGSCPPQPVGLVTVGVQLGFPRHLHPSWRKKKKKHNSKKKKLSERERNSNTTTIKTGSPDPLA